jgi:hypothetical protein
MRKAAELPCRRPQSVPDDGWRQVDLRAQIGVTWASSPLIELITWIARWLFGDSLPAIRFLRAVAGAAEVALTALIARTQRQAVCPGPRRPRYPGAVKSRRVGRELGFATANAPSVTFRKGFIRTQAIGWRLVRDQ